VSQSPPLSPGPTHPISPLAAFLSYLIPGLGQVYQGRFGKGMLFFACIYILFFYGNALGSGTVTINGETYRVSGSVYLPDVYVPRPRNGWAQAEVRAQGVPGDAGVPAQPVRAPFALDRLGTNLYNRLQFVGQFWVGIAAWPALWQYARYGNDPTTPDPTFGLYMREPSEPAINAVQTAGSKTMDLGWVFTVIAGVLNIMVIYDAFAGPAVPRASLQPVSQKETPAEKEPETEPTPARDA
jgi:hypothetical protein